MKCVLVLLFLPLTGFSFDLSDVAERLRAIPRVEVAVDAYDSDERMFARAVAAADRCDVVLAGYSAGGNGAARVAERLDLRMIPVRLLVMFDPPDRPPELGLPQIRGNVEQAVNYFQRVNPILGGGVAKRAPRNRLTLSLTNVELRRGHLWVIDDALKERFVGQVRAIVRARLPRPG